MSENTSTGEVSPAENTTTGAVSAAPKKPQSKIVRWFSIVVGLILMASGLLKVYHVFVPELPACTSASADTSIHNIFKQKNVELTSLTNIKSITDTSSEKTCQADFLTPAETGTIYYQISKEDGSTQLRITKVDTHPR